MKKSKLLLITGIFAVMAMVFTGCSEDDGGGKTVKVTGVTLSEGSSTSGSSTIYVNSTDAALPASVTFTVTIAPANASKKGVSWTVTNTGTFVEWDEATKTVTAKAKGSAYVTVKTNDGGKRDSWNITVADANEHIAVQSVSINNSSPLNFYKNGGAYTPPTVQLDYTILPNNASNKMGEWSVPSTDVVTVSSTGVVTPVGLGQAVITFTCADNQTKTATINVSVTEGNPPEEEYELKLSNQSAPSSGTTSTLPAMDTTTKRWTITNNETAQGNGFNNAGFAGTTAVYLDTPLGNNASISARVRVTETKGSGSDTGGVVVGMFKNPVGASDIQFCGVRLSTNTSRQIRMYATRDGAGPNSSAVFSPDLIGEAVTTEYIITVTRTNVQAYSLKVDNASGVNLATGARSGASQIIDLGSVYAGFIIAKATVEISQITVKENDTVIYESPASSPTVTGPPPVESVEFTAPAVAGSAGNYTYTHSTFGGNNTLVISAQALPATASAADKVVSWAVTSGPAQVSVATGGTVTATFSDTTGVAVVTASAGGQSAKLTITLTDEEIQVTGVTVNAAGGKTSIMAGDGAAPAETLQFSAAFEPAGASASVAWSLSASSTFADTDTVSDCTITSGGLLTAPANYTGADISIYVFAKAGEIVSPGKLITVKGYSAANPVIWEYNAGDVTFNDTTNVQTIHGISAFRSGGHYKADATGIVMETSSRFILGYSGSSGGTLSSTGAAGSTTATAYITNGQLNLNRKFSVTIEYTTATTGDLYIYLQNNTTSNGASVFGSGSLKSTTTTVGSGSFTATFDPASLTLNSGVTGVTKGDILEKSFLQFRTAEVTTLTKITIKEVP